MLVQQNLKQQDMQTDPGVPATPPGHKPYAENMHGNAVSPPALVPFAESMHGKAKSRPDMVPFAERMQTNPGGLGESTGHVPYAGGKQSEAKMLPALVPLAESMHGKAKRPRDLMPFTERMQTNPGGSGTSTGHVPFAGRKHGKPKYMLSFAVC